MNERLKKVDDIFSARVKDIIFRAGKNKKPCFIGFLNETQVKEAESIAKRFKSNYFFWGGYKDALRLIFGVFPEESIPDCKSFPVIALYISFSTRYKISHRDFLGALMSLGLSRDTIGDILVGDGVCVMFVKSDIAEFIKLNLLLVGNIRVNFVSSEGIELPHEDRFESISKTVVSPRLDAVVSSIANISRNKAVELIKQNKVTVNHRQINSLSAIICEGDILSIRGKGKFIIDELGSLTRKKRIKLLVRKYK